MLDDGPQLFHKEILNGAAADPDPRLSSHLVPTHKHIKSVSSDSLHMHISFTYLQWFKNDVIWFHLVGLNI